MFSLKKSGGSRGGAAHDPRLATCEQDELAPIANVPMSHRLKIYLSSLIRGNIQDKRLIFSDAWVSVQNVLDAFNTVKKQHWSTKTLIGRLRQQGGSCSAVTLRIPEPTSWRNLCSPHSFELLKASPKFWNSRTPTSPRTGARGSRELGWVYSHAAFAGRPLIPIEEVPPRLSTVALSEMPRSPS